MKKIELTCFDQQSQSVEFVLKKFKVPYHAQLVISGERKLIKFNTIVPDDLNRDIIEQLKKLLDTKNQNIYLINNSLESTTSSYLTQLDEKLKPKKEGKTTEEFQAIVEPSVAFRKDLLYMIVIASGVALVGLFTDNGALVIGGMLLAPLLGPITAFSFNIAVAQPQKILKAALSGFSLIVAAGATGAVVTFILSSMGEVPLTEEILLRTETSPIFVAMAIALGIAGGIALSSNVPGLLVGVAVAAALVPPAVVTGIGLSLVDWEIFSKAFILTLVNVIGLVLGTMIVFFAKKVDPIHFYEKEAAKKYLMLSIGSFVGLSILLGIISI